MREKAPAQECKRPHEQSRCRPQNCLDMFCWKGRVEGGGKHLKMLSGNSLQGRGSISASLVFLSLLPLRFLTLLTFIMPTVKEKKKNDQEIKSNIEIF